MTTKESRKRRAMRHADVLGAGAAKRRSLPAKERAGVVMSEYARGTLNSGSGHKVKKKAQAMVIAMSESGKSKKRK